MVLKGEIYNNCTWVFNFCTLVCDLWLKWSVYMCVCGYVFVLLFWGYFYKLLYTCLMYSAISASDIFALPNVLMLKAQINNSRLALVALSDKDAEYTAVRAKTDRMARNTTRLILRWNKLLKASKLFCKLF